MFTILSRIFKLLLYIYINKFIVLFLEVILSILRFYHKFLAFDIICSIKYLLSFVLLSVYFARKWKYFAILKKSRSLCNTKGKGKSLSYVPFRALGGGGECLIERTFSLGRRHSEVEWTVSFHAAFNFSGIPTRQINREEGQRGKLPQALNV